MTIPDLHRRCTSKSMKALAIAAAAVMVLTSCAGQAGGGSDGGGGESVPVGSSPEDFREALSDMPETTLVYQPVAPSQNSASAPRALEFKENVEEASGGKITIDLVWGQAVAGFSEIDDALVDGRVDIADTLPKDTPAEYPVYNAFVAGTTVPGTTPRAGELATNAAMLELAWESDALIEEFESRGLHVLLPFLADGDQLLMCTEPGSSASDLENRQVRAASEIHNRQVDVLGASPISLEFTEMYEALQRNTVDCALSHGLTGSDVGILEVAPNFLYSEEFSIARGPNSVVAGTGFEELPLAAQQLVYDEMATVFKNHRATSLEGTLAAAEAARENNGSFEPLDAESADRLKAQSEEFIEEQVESGIVPENFAGDIDDSYEKWLGIVEELGLGDEGDFADFDQWHDPSDVDLEEFSNRVYEEAMAEHRPE